MRGEIVIFLACVAAATCGPRAAFSFASYYGNSMVLQMSPKATTVWGYGSPGSYVTVSVDGTQSQGQVNGNGVWSVTLDPHGQGGPYTVTATQAATGETIQLNDVYFGDVWVCSGQSNMWMAMKDIYNGSQEIQEGLAYNQVRLFYVQLTYSETPQEDLMGIATPWSVPTQGTLSTFSALCFLYGRRLYDQLKRPIGLIESNYWGTPIEAWMSPEARQSCNAAVDISPKVDQNSPSVLWNAMIHPLLKMSVRGAIWYQGESNVVSSNNYSCEFPTMINDWKNKWFEGIVGPSPTFPFGFVQLAPNAHNVYDPWSLLRWHQTADYGYAPNSAMPESFMAAAFDLPDDNSPNGTIHPRDKTTVADRLGWAGLNVAYQMTQYPTHGPQVTGLSKQGNNVVLTYDSTISVLNNNGFQVYCTQGSNSPSDVPTTSYTSNSVTVDISSCPQAYRLAYEWRETPCAYKQCAIYGMGPYNLPAPTWIWDI